MKFIQDTFETVKKTGKLYSEREQELQELADLAASVSKLALRTENRPPRILLKKKS